MKLINFLVVVSCAILLCTTSIGNAYKITQVKTINPHGGKVPQALVLLEGPHWDSQNQWLLYVDIENHEVHRFVPATGIFTTVNINAGRTSLVIPIRGQPNKYIIGVERNLMILEWNGVSTVPTSLTVHKPLNAEDSPRSRLNDGKCDPRGRLWAGTMHESGGQPNGNLYKLETDDTLTRMVGGIGTSNGLAWSLDNNTMYYIDTNTGKVDAFDYNINVGSVANRRTIFDVWGSGVGGSPDGMTIDQDGNLWVATWGGSKILNINPRDGRLIQTVDFTGDASLITSAAFGGPNLDTMYVTTSDSGNPSEGGGGKLWEVKDLGTRGVSGGVSFCLHC